MVIAPLVILKALLSMLKHMTKIKQSTRPDYSRGRAEEQGMPWRFLNTSQSGEYGVTAKDTEEIVS